MENQGSYRLNKDHRVRRGNPSDLWAWRKNLRYDILARYRGITKMIFVEESESMLQYGDPASIPNEDYSGLWALRKNYRYDLLSSHRGITEMTAGEDGQQVEMAVAARQLHMAETSYQFSRIAFSKIRYRNPASIPSKDSAGLWALRKKCRYELLARFRKIDKSMMEDEAMDCTEATPVMKRNPVRWESEQNQGWTPHRYPSGLRKTKEPHWFRKYNYMARNRSKMATSKQQDLKSSNYGGNSMNRSNSRFNGWRQRNWGSSNGKYFPQAQTQRTYPGYYRLCAAERTKYGRSNFRQQTANCSRYTPGKAFTTGSSNSCNHYQGPLWNQRLCPQQGHRGRFVSWNQTRFRGNVVQSGGRGWTNRNGSNNFQGPQTFRGQRANRFSWLEVEKHLRSDSKM
ncbi:uncharacterized protein LOC110369078 [Fundulus heteroclitus]|uniref:uncharacterized protein LOC110369078 n=1 Tax=Fundulus heteroclitus TaxID=8078 RepID=UPI00165CA076|nr:uncharacterized protein LOC110369078 [Fundulus heteroclitus]XP_021176692.2 uncharacterized protein LOC110369078 [Fundulus heteroclitus]